jgi:hypothetical protein
LTPAAYTTALATLGLSQADAACAWLGVTRSTHYRYAQLGPTEPVARLITLAVRLRGLERLSPMIQHDEIFTMMGVRDGIFVRHADVTDALGLPVK